MQKTPVSFSEFSETIGTLFPQNKGIFLTAGIKKPNPMIISWGTAGVFWGEQVFIAGVRYSRNTWKNIQETGEFTLSIPTHPLPEELMQGYKISGSKSGRYIDKFAACGMTALLAEKVETPIIGGCSMHAECKVIYTSTVDPAALADDRLQAVYENGDFHTLFYGKILALYRTEG